MISSNPELEACHQDKIQIEVMSDVVGSRALPDDTVYIIKTSGSTGPVQVSLRDLWYLI